MPAPVATLEPERPEGGAPERLSGRDHGVTGRQGVGLVARDVDDILERATALDEVGRHRRVVEHQRPGAGTLTRGRNALDRPDQHRRDGLVDENRARGSQVAPTEELGRHASGIDSHEPIPALVPRSRRVLRRRDVGRRQVHGSAVGRVVANPRTPQVQNVGQHGGRHQPVAEDRAELRRLGVVVPHRMGLDKLRSDGGGSAVWVDPGERVALGVGHKPDVLDAAAPVLADVQDVGGEPEAGLLRETGGHDDLPHGQGGPSKLVPVLGAGEKRNDLRDLGPATRVHADGLPAAWQGLPAVAERHR